MSKKKVKQKFKTWADATPEERRGAMRMAGLWTSSEVEGLTEYGAFSEQNLGLPAVEYFPLRAYRTLKAPDCKWQWKEGAKLSTLFINVMKSDMAHTLRHYKDNGEPDLRAASELHWHGSDDADDDADRHGDRNSPLEVDAAVREDRGRGTGTEVNPNCWTVKQSLRIREPACTGQVTYH